jgi:Protein of unknown function (DUF2510)
MGTAEIVPGWYADPMVPGQIRYWDGSGWTEHTAAPLPSVIAHPSTTDFATANLAIAAPSPLQTPRAPRRRLPLPALFVLGTALVGIPLAITIGVLAAHAAAPEPLPVRHVPPTTSTQPSVRPSAHPSPQSSPQSSADAAAAAKKDVTAIAEAVQDFYSTPSHASTQPPTVIFAFGKYSMILHPEPGGSSDPWSWPDIVASDGVVNAGVWGSSPDTWCAWVYMGEDSGQIWHATAKGVSSGDCVIE